MTNYEQIFIEIGLLIFFLGVPLAILLAWLQ